jgi:GR25 family glycosyltransferase involved in LPS biosynthesis
LTNTDINVDHVYICHWNKLIDRKKHVLNQLITNNITNYSFVELYDKNNWNKQDIQKEYPIIFEKTKRDRRHLKMSEISLLLKHCWCIKDAFDKNYQSIMILEDDIILCNNFIYYFNKFKSQLPHDWDCCWVGGCCGLNSLNTTASCNVYSSQTSRCCHCYIISKRCINKLINEIKNIDEGIDWYYNDIIPRLKLNAFWFEPSLAEQSTEFETTVQIKE